MKHERIVCPECKGLGVIGTSVGSTLWRGRTYDCDECHGLGDIDLFAGLPDEVKVIDHLNLEPDEQADNW